MATRIFPRRPKLKRLAIPAGALPAVLDNTNIINDDRIQNDKILLISMSPGVIRGDAMGFSCATFVRAVFDVSHAPSIIVRSILHAVTTVVLCLKNALYLNLNRVFSLG